MFFLVLFVLSLLAFENERKFILLFAFFTYYLYNRNMEERMEDKNLKMFKPYDIRSKVENLDSDIISRLSRATALYFKEYAKVESVLICRDARLYVPSLAESLIASLRDVGITTLVNPLPISTCQFYYTLMQYPEAGGIMVTASHNPGNYVGLKLLAKDLFPIAYGCGPEGGIEKIKELYIEDRKVQNCEKGKCIVVNKLNEYIDYSMHLAGVKEDSLKGLKVLLEFLSGSVGTEVALAFQKAGADIEVRHLIPDGFFPSGDPNPIIESSIAPARKAMKEGNFDIGFCFDGDGDRMDLMYKTGEQIVPGLNMSIIAPYIMDIYKGEKREFYADVKAIPEALCEIAKSGANVHIIRNGHSFIKAKLRDNCDKGYFASEEESAHYYMNFPYDTEDFSRGFAAVESTLFFALLTAKCYLLHPEKYERAYKIQNSIYREREWPLHCEAAPEKMPEILEEVEKIMVKEGAMVIKDMDDGSDLDATLMRFNLPLTFDSSSSLEGKMWAQVAQRISRSEDAMCRWEVVSNDEKECLRLNGLVKSVTDKYVNAGFAKY